MTKLFLSLFLLLSCDSHYKVKKGNGLFYVEDLKFELSNFQQIPWKVGRKRDKIISQGFTFEIGLPKLSEEGITMLHGFGIDSWLFTIKKHDGQIERELGYIQYNFDNMGSHSNSFTVKTLYHAASVSHTFRNFHCPAFNHRLRIREYELEEFKQRPQNLYSNHTAKVPRRVSIPRFTMLSFSGGRSLKGMVWVTLNFFNSKTKTKYGSELRSENYIRVSKEESVSLPSCLGIKEENRPLPESRPATIEDLRIR